MSGKAYGTFIRIDWQNLVDENPNYWGVSDREELARDTLSLEEFDRILDIMENFRPKPTYNEDDIWE